MSIAIRVDLKKSLYAGPRIEQSSTYGRPIAIVYGTQRVTGNVILSGWYMENKVTGKGGYASWASGLVQIAICEGPISEVLNIWIGQAKNTPAGWGIDTIQTGARSQAPWSYITTNFPLFALGYGGTAVACESTAWTFKADAQLAQGSYEVSGLFTTATGLAATVHPATVIADLLTNAEYGLGWDSARIDGFDNSSGTPVAFTAGIDGTTETSFYNLCTVGGFGIALAIEEQRPAREIIEEIATATDSLCVWSEGKLKLRPLAGWTHANFDGSAALAPAYSLGSDHPGADFLAAEGENPIEVEQVATKDTYNCFPIEWTNRAPSRKNVSGTAIAEPLNAYNVDVEDGTADTVDVAANGTRKASPTSLRCIVQQSHAAYVANILASRSLYQRNQYRFRLGWRYALLEPGDIVTLTDAGLGLAAHVVRILEIEESEDNSFDVVAEDVTAASGVAGFLPLIALMSDSPVFGSCSGNPCTAVSAAATVTAYGGSGTYTYAWARVSGSTFTINSPTAAATTFQKSVSALESGVYRCTVTDTVTGNVAYSDVTVELEGGA